MREKLIELLKQIPQVNHAEAYVHGMDYVFGCAADHLLANGVTVQQWIPVTERLPENDYGKHWKERPHYLVCLANGLMRVATFGYKEYGWWIDSHNCVLSKEHYTEVTHWMPLPPKEG